MPRSTSSASASCGTHLGFTKLVASTTGSPAAARRSMSSILVCAGTIAASFCSPSRGPTSTIVTWPGKSAICRESLRFILCRESLRSILRIDIEIHQRLSAVDLVAGRAEHGGDRAVGRRADGVLHLHGLDDDQLVALADLLSAGHAHG